MARAAWSTEPVADIAAVRRKSIPIAMRLRRYHRWVSTAAMVILVWVSVTGVALAIDVWASGRKHESAPPPSAPIPRAQAAAWIATALGTAARVVPDGAEAVAASLAIAGDGQPRVTLTIGQGREPRTVIEVDPVAKAIVSARAMPPELSSSPWRSTLHRLLEDLHRGTIIGLPGQLLSVLAGISFVFLTVSGLWVYIDMWRKRCRAGRPATFWSR